MFALSSLNGQVHCMDWSNQYALLHKIISFFLKHLHVTGQMKNEGRWDYHLFPINDPFRNCCSGLCSYLIYLQSPQYEHSLFVLLQHNASGWGIFTQHAFAAGKSIITTPTNPNSKDFHFAVMCFLLCSQLIEKYENPSSFF